MKIKHNRTQLELAQHRYDVLISKQTKIVASKTSKPEHFEKVNAQVMNAWEDLDKARRENAPATS